MLKYESLNSIFMFKEVTLEALKKRDYAGRIC